MPLSPSFDWFLWTFQVVWLLVVAVAWHRRTLARYQAALWAMGATITCWFYSRIDFALSLELVR